jgi:ribosomal protein L3
MSKAYSPRRGSLSFVYRQVKGSDLIPKYSPLGVLYSVKVGMDLYEVQPGILKPITILEIPLHKIKGYSVYSKSKSTKLKDFYDLDSLKDYISKISEEYTINYILHIELSSVNSLSYNKPIFRQIFADTKSLYKPQEIVTQNLIDNLKLKDFVDITSISKGKGFSGVIKKYGLRVKKRKHARANKTRHIGAIGSRGWGRVTRYSKQAGTLGCYRRTICNIKLLKSENSIKSFPNQYFYNYGITGLNSLAILGSIPGPCKRIVLIRKPFRI